MMIRPVMLLGRYAGLLHKILSEDTADWLESILHTRTATDFQLASPADHQFVLQVTLCHGSDQGLFRVRIVALRIASCTK